jgi:hypothetical protein
MYGNSVALKKTVSVPLTSLTPLRFSCPTNCPSKIFNHCRTRKFNLLLSGYFQHKRIESAFQGNESILGFLFQNLSKEPSPFFSLCRKVKGQLM